MKVGLVACCAKKADAAAPAADLYQSELFRRSRAYVESTCDAWGILSAKHGLLLPGQEESPYDLSLNTMPSPQVRSWAQSTREQLVRRWPEARFLVLAGRKYRAALEGLPISCPLEGLGIGQQLRWLATRSAQARFHCVTGNRDHVTLEGLKVSGWRLVEGHDYWLTSLVYSRSRLDGHLPAPGFNIVDCGAWSYKSDAFPRWGPEEAAKQYADFARPGDVITSPDHMILRGHDAGEGRRRVGLTLDNARRFIALAPAHLEPMAVVHGHDVGDRVDAASRLLDMGYRYLALGGLAYQAGNRSFILPLLERIVALRERWRFRLHVLGVSALSYLAVYRALGVDSYDGSAMFYAAFAGATYYVVDPGEEFLVTKHSVREGAGGRLPDCDCLACVTLRRYGHDPRQMGCNENNMGRAFHNVNMYLRARRILESRPRQGQGATP